MKLSRREAFVALGGATLLAGCNPVSGQMRKLEQTSLPAPTKADDEAVAVLNRFGFGPSPRDLEAVRKKGVDDWFESQLSPSDDEPAMLGYQLQRLDINSFGPWDLRDWKEEAIVEQLQQAAVLRAVYSPWQVRERLCDFWTNHFNIYARKGLAAYRKPMDEREVVRKNVLGKFPEMVRASAHSAAMLVYLDQQNSNANQANENYARELMELHTLGVHGGYTQEDVMEVARCFTGWSEERGFLQRKGAFVFLSDRHDNGEKTVLGHKIPAGGGVEDGEKVIQIVTEHPATSKYIASKMCRYFLGEEGSAHEDAVAEIYRETGGDIKAMMRSIFGAFKSSKNTVLKRPFDYVVSAMRATDAASTAGKGVLDHMASMGQALYLWPMPDGYPVDTTSWTGSMLARWNFALALTSGEIGGTSVNLKKLTANLDGSKAAQAVFVCDSSHPAIRRLSEIVAGFELPEQVALCLASPEFQWK